MKITCSKLYTELLLIWWFLFLIAHQTTIGTSLGIPTGSICSGGWLIIKILLLFLIVMYGRRNPNAFIKSAVILLFGLITEHCSQNDMLEPFYWFMAAAQHVNVKDIIKKLYRVQIIVIALVILLALTGIITNEVVKRTDGELRYALGFDHPNTTGIMLLQVTGLSFLLNYRKHDIKKYWIYIPTVALSYFGADSRTSSYLMVILLIISIILDVSRRGIFKKALVRVLRHAVLITIVFVLAVFAAIFGYIRIGVSDYTFGTRLSLALNFYKYYGVKLFGQKIVLGIQDKRFINTMYTLDNAYMYLLLAFGLLAFIAFLVIYIKTVRDNILEKRYGVVILLLIYLLVGFSETALIRLVMNFTLIFMFESVWKKHKNKIESQKTMTGAVYG